MDRKILMVCDAAVNAERPWRADSAAIMLLYVASCFVYEL